MTSAAANAFRGGAQDHGCRGNTEPRLRPFMPRPDQELPRGRRNLLAIADQLLADSPELVNAGLNDETIDGVTSFGDEPVHPEPTVENLYTVDNSAAEPEPELEFSTRSLLGFTGPYGSLLSRQDIGLPQRRGRGYSSGIDPIEDDLPDFAGFRLIRSA